MQYIVSKHVINVNLTTRIILFYSLVIYYGSRPFIVKCNRRTLIICAFDARYVYYIRIHKKLLKLGRYFESECLFFNVLGIFNRRKVVYRET